MAMKEKPAYYEWILHGHELLKAINHPDVIEVFPTAA